MNNTKPSFASELSFFLSVPALLWQVFFLFIPLVIVIYFSFAGAVSFSLEHYQQLLTTSFVRIVLRSCLLATATACTTLCIAYPVVYWIVRCAGRYKQACMVAIMVPFWVNSLMLAYSWFFLLERHGLINMVLAATGIIREPLHLANTIGAAYVVMVYSYLPFMAMPLYAALEKLDVRLLEASADLGATPFQTFIRVTLPLSLSGVTAGFLLVFVPAFGDFALPTLLGGSKFMVVGSLISYYFFIARSKGLGAACTLCAGLVLLFVVVLVQRFSTRFVSINQRELS